MTESWAFISECETYRYSLTRRVAPLTGEGTVAFVMLNPSTADAEQDDPTIDVADHLPDCPVEQRLQDEFGF